MTLYIRDPGPGLHRRPNLLHRSIDWFLYYWNGR